MLISKTKKGIRNKNKSYKNIHIKHLVDNNEYVNKIGRRLHWQIIVKQDANQLDGKQRHPGFDYYEYDMPIFGTTTPGWGDTQSSLDRSTTSNSFNFQEHLEDFEHDQARYQGIHGQG